MRHTTNVGMKLVEGCNLGKWKIGGEKRARGTFG